MTAANPFQSPQSPEDQPSQAAKPLEPEREAYNLVTDVIAGPNLRWKDNLFQAIAILVSIGIGVIVGYFVATEKPLGVILGGGAGLLVGLFGSGVFLMVWRAIRHARGRHD